MKEGLITLVWFDMINNSCGYYLISFEMKLAECLLLKLVITKPVPAFGVIESVPG